jgi:rare lipoprotein A
MHQVKGEKMKYSLISLILMISIVLPTVAEAKKHKVHNVHHVNLSKAKTVHHARNNHSGSKISIKSPNKKGTLNNNSVGMASWYGYESGKRYRHKPKTASGETFNPNRLTAAHKKLPFGTKVKVTNLKNNLSTTVIINDRGPFVRGRIIDLSKGAAKAIRMDGVQRVSLTVIS